MSKSFEQMMTETRAAINFVGQRDGTIDKYWGDPSVNYDELIKSTEKNNIDSLTKNIKSIIDKPDDEKIIITPEPVIYKPDGIVASNTNEMLMIYKAIGAQIGVSFNERVIIEGIKHESQHAEAARKAGSKVLYLVVINNIFANRIIVHPAIRHIGNIKTKQLTKLGVASVIARPDELSQGDIAQLKSMGYKGPQDICDRIKHSNNPELSSLLIPRSCINKDYLNK